ncbi:MAG: CHAD domain-containing protein [Candidatus Krumholzibacteriia bacterium]
MPATVASQVQQWWQTVCLHAEACRQEPRTETVHQLRTHLRRLRSLADQLRADLPQPAVGQVRSILRDITGRTGQLRDLDVLIAAEEDWIALLPPGLEPGGREVWQHLRRERQWARELLEGYLAGDLFRDQCRLLERLLPEIFTDPEGRLDGLLAARVRRTWQQVAADAANLDAQSGPEPWHRLRKRAKRLRYGLEAQPGSKPRRSLLAALKRLQDRLGAFNDAAVQHALLVRLARDEWSPAALQALGAWRVLLHQRQVAQARRLPVALSRFCGTPNARLLDKVLPPES